MRTEHWLYRVSLFKNQLSEVPRHAYLFLGDSITEQFPLEKFFSEWVVINRGINGDHIDGVIERLDSSAIALNPEMLFLMIGVNDINNGRSNEYIKEKYAELLKLLQGQLAYTQIYIQSILPVSSDFGKSMQKQIKNVNDYLNEYSQKDNMHFLDLYKNFVDENSSLHKKLTHDGLHLNLNGYSLWSEILKKTLQKEIE